MKKKYNTGNERILWILKEPWTYEVHEAVKVSDYISYINNFKFMNTLNMILQLQCGVE